jgi:hypothetical protein
MPDLAPTYNTRWLKEIKMKELGRRYLFLIKNSFFWVAVVLTFVIPGLFQNNEWAFDICSRTFSFLLTMPIYSVLLEALFHGVLFHTK